MLRAGARWKVGSGMNIRVWSQPWIKDDENFWVRTVCPTGLENMRVGELIHDLTNTWDVGLIHTIFDEVDAVRIKNTALPPSGIDDKLVWHGSRDGLYSVKAGYRLATHLCRDLIEETPGNWTAIWRLKVPPKVKDFMWRLCHDCLPNRVNLFRKRVVDNKYCAVCGEYEESNWHLFISCQFAKECWERAHLFKSLDNLMLQVGGCTELVFAFLAEQPRDKVVAFVMILWQIWKERNSRVWGSGRQSPTQVIFTSAVVLEEWESAQNQRPKSVNSDVGVTLPDQTEANRCRLWHRPGRGMLKANVDAAFHADTNQTGCGIVIRDEAGTFIMAKTVMRNGCIDVEVGEAMGFLEALSWVKALGLEDVVIEGDCKVVVDAINSSSTTISTSVFGDYIYTCKNILTHSPSFKVCFVRREANQLAHEFARGARDYGHSFCWLDPPTFVDGLIDLHCGCTIGN